MNDNNPTQTIPDIIAMLRNRAVAIAPTDNQLALADWLDIAWQAEQREVRNLRRIIHGQRRALRSYQMASNAKIDLGPDFAKIVEAEEKEANDANA